MRERTQGEGEEKWRERRKKGADEECEDQIDGRGRKKGGHFQTRGAVALRGTEAVPIYGRRGGRLTRLGVDCN